jgi:hypothetical protein
VFQIKIHGTQHPSFISKSIFSQKNTTYLFPTMSQQSNASSNDPEEIGDRVAGATEPRTVITYTMAGGGSHWWNYEVHFDKDGTQQEVYVNNKDGKRLEDGMRIFYNEDDADLFRLEPADFTDEKWPEFQRFE